MRHIIRAAIMAASTFLSAPVIADPAEPVFGIFGAAPQPAVTHRHRAQRHGYVHRTSAGASSSLATQIALQHGAPPAVVHAIIKIESGGRCGASNGGSKGIMQVNPATARSVGVHGNLLDCRTGLEAGVRYLMRSIATQGRTCAAYSAYNSGRIGSSGCTSYGRKVMRLARE